MRQYGGQVSVIPRAVSNRRGCMDIYTTPKHRTFGSISLHIQRGRYAYEVEVCDFKKQVRDWEPDIVKADCEGAEYDFLYGTHMPECVRQVVTELHLNRHEWRHNLAPQVILSFEDWETVTKPWIGPRNWHTIGLWRR